MNSVERVKAICRERRIPISKLERELGYANGYIGQLKKGVFPDNRLSEIADYLSVSAEYLMSGIPSVDMYEVIDYLCRKNGVTLEQMCVGSGVSLDTISGLKEKKISCLSYNDQAAIANYFKISADVFSEGVFEETLPNEADAQAITGYHYLKTKNPTPVSESGQQVNIITLANRNGQYTERILSDEQIALFQSMLDQMKPIDDENI